MSGKYLLFGYMEKGHIIPGMLEFRGNITPLLQIPLLSMGGVSIEEMHINGFQKLCKDRYLLSSVKGNF
jgi:hypothetical protein